MTNLPPDVREFIDLDLSEANLRGQDLSGRRFVRCLFNRANLSNTIFNGCAFVDCELSESNFEGMRAEHTTFTRVLFDRPRLHHVKLGYSSFNGGSLQNADLYDAELQHAEIKDVQMGWMHATSTRLDGARITGTTLKGAEFLKVWLDGATLENVTFAQSLFRAVEMKNTIWRKVDLSEASLFEVDLTDAEFEDCLVFGLGVCRVRGIPRRQERINCAADGEPQLIVNDVKLAPFLAEIDRDDAMGRLIEALSSKLVLLLGRFTVEPKEVLDRLHRAFRARGYIPAIIDFKFSGLLSADDAVRAIALCARFVVADVTDAHAVRAEVPQILGLRAVPVMSIVAAGNREPIQFKWLRRHYPHLLLPVYEYSSLETLIEEMERVVIDPCEEALARLRQWI